MITREAPVRQRRADRIRLASPQLGDEEIAAVAKVLRSGVLTDGPITAEFERSFADRHQVDHAVAFCNGTVALTAMYMALNITAGDEVIVPSMTFISSATSVVHVGASPVFADVDAATFNLDPADVARKVTPRTRAILAVHYGGQAADMDELRAIADDAGILLLEDAAEAHGAMYRDRSVGSLGDAAMFSFTPTKNITTGEGGMVTTNRGDLARKLRLLRNHGQTNRYDHDSLGFNWRLTEMQAAIGVVQTAKLDGILAQKRRNAQRMAELLSTVTGIRSPVARPDRRHCFMIYTVLVDRDRNHVMAALLTQDIEARLYFPPAHRQRVFDGGRVDLPVTDWLGEHMLSIPFHAQMSDVDLVAVAAALALATRTTVVEQEVAVRSQSGHRTAEGARSIPVGAALARPTTAS
jgi:perosamine synthetase